jgi:S1-C subfamily serine protease
MNASGGDVVIRLRFVVLGLALWTLGCDDRVETLKGPVAVVSGKLPTYGMLGVEFVADAGRSLEIREVLPGSGAEMAGLVAGDKVTSLDDHAVRNFAEFIERLKVTQPGASARVGIVRGSEAKVAEVRLMSAAEVVAIRAAMVKVQGVR